jgi:PAS domain S-box-containing protein
MKSKAQTILLNYGGAAVLTALAVLLRWLLGPWLGEHLPLATLYGAVAVAVWLGGYRPALLAVVFGYLACGWLFIEPRGAFGLGNARNLIGLVAYLVSCGIIIGFGEALLTSRRRVESRQDDLRIVTDSMAAPVTRCSRDLKYLWVSKPYAEWIDRPANDITGQPIVTVIGPEAFERLRPHFQEVLSGRVVRYEEQVHFQGIGTRWISALYTPTLDSDGVPDGWVAVVNDLTERKWMEEALRTSENRLAIELEAISRLHSLSIACWVRLMSAEHWTTCWRTPS